MPRPNTSERAFLIGRDKLQVFPSFWLASYESALSTICRAGLAQMAPLPSGLDAQLVALKEQYFQYGVVPSAAFVCSRANMFARSQAIMLARLSARHTSQTAG
jgi:hypothetical protein